MKGLPIMKIPGSDGFTGEFYLTFEEEIIQFLYRFIQKIEEAMLWGQHNTKPHEDITRKENYRTIFPMTINEKSLIKQQTGHINLLIKGIYKRPTAGIVLYSQNWMLSS